MFSFKLSLHSVTFILIAKVTWRAKRWWGTWCALTNPEVLGWRCRSVLQPGWSSGSLPSVTSAVLPVLPSFPVLQFMSWLFPLLLIRKLKLLHGEGESSSWPLSQGISNVTQALVFFAFSSISLSSAFLFPGIRQLQLILLKVALILGIEIHVNVEFRGLVYPPEDQENESK